MQNSFGRAGSGRFIFITADGSERIFQPREEQPRIHAMAEHLRTRVTAGGIVGLLGRSEPELILGWFAAISAGLRPLILQYPTRKQSRAYWIDSVQNTIGLTGMAALIADSHCAGMGLSTVSQLILLDDLAALPPAADAMPKLPEAFAIVQLSSGTTGYRKAMQFTSADLARHVADYNRVLGLSPQTDCIVSWLPLYHDMGYVACFVMPILLGLDVVMIDPIDWVGRPELLLDGIERHGGTICYMPNFGFEVMARVLAERDRPAALGTMRYWISCSEPVSAATAEKFLRAAGAPPESFCPCYAMAENIFAVTFARGLHTIQQDAASLVSCGQAIPDVELKIVDGEIWVRGPTSLRCYLDGEDIRDAEGFYATGDLGCVQDGMLYVSGRKQDLLIQAGRKFLLSDIDLRLNEIRPDVRGRGATLAIRDERVGTETPTVLIEAQDFFERTDAGEIASALKGATGLDQMEVAFVPPRFLTKTSSGKINRRKTAADWVAAQAARTARLPARDYLAELPQSFGNVDWHRPAREVLDSLSMTILKIILDGSKVAVNPEQTLQAHAALLAERKPAPENAESGIRIVSIADLSNFRGLTEAHLDLLGQAWRCKVSFEHISLPPTPIVLSDVIFHDYFQPRLAQEHFASVDRAMARLKGASLLVLDDTTEMFFAGQATYPALSHNLERDARADLISYRWSDYVRQHHDLPLAVVGGPDLPLQILSNSAMTLGRYLGCAVFRIARFESFAPYTSAWDYHCGGSVPTTATLDPDALVRALVDWVAQRRDRLPIRPLPADRISVSDAAHFCSHKVRQAPVDYLLDRFESFIVAGQSSSVPYVERELSRRGKKYVRIASHSRASLAMLEGKYDCLLSCGTWGRLKTDIPAVALQHLGRNARIVNLQMPWKSSRELDEICASGEDWFHGFKLGAKQDAKIWNASRRERVDETNDREELRPAVTAPMELSDLPRIIATITHDLDRIDSESERQLAVRTMRLAIRELRKAIDGLEFAKAAS